MVQHVPHLPPGHVPHLPDTTDGGGGPDTIPDAFSFEDIIGVALSTEFTSNIITISGLGAADSADVSITGGTYSKNGGAYTSAATTAVNGDTFSVRRNSSGSYNTAVSVVLTIGGVSDTYSITTGIQVPNVVGNSQATAVSTLTGAGFVVSLQTAYSSVVDEGDVIYQLPAAAAVAAPGTTVTISISLGEMDTQNDPLFGTPSLFAGGSLFGTNVLF
jgi:hypothetical protein